MAHQHQVVDGDIRFTINPVTRAISRADAKKSSLVVGDHNSERFTFEIPKFVEGHDMSLCNVIRVHYLNTSSDNKAVQSLGVYEVDDFGPDLEDETTMKFSWLISRKATKHVGPLAFTIQFACMTGFKVDYSWQSGVFSGITVSNAVNGAEVVIEEYADVLRQWWEQLYAASELPISVMPFEDFAALNGDTKNGMLYLISDDPAVEDLEKIPSIEQDVDILEKEVDGMKTKIGNLEQKVDDLPEFTSEIQQTNKKVSSIEDDMDELSTVLDELAKTYVSRTDLEDGIVIPRTAGEAHKDVDGNYISTTYVKKDELLDGSVVAQKATCDGLGRNIQYTYAKLDQQKVFSGIQHEYFEFEPFMDMTHGMLPSGRSLNDIVGVGLDVKIIAADRDMVLKFSGSKTDTIKHNVYTGKDEVTFYLTAPVRGGVNLYCGSYAEVVLYVDEEDMVHSVVKDCGYWQKKDGSEAMTYEARLDDMDFGYGSLVYWFA